MKTYILLENKKKLELPEQFHTDDVRYSESLVEYFINEFTQVGDTVFDPFVGFGTTMIVAESMNRYAFGLEFSKERVQHAKSKLKFPEKLIEGDSRKLLSYDFPEFDFSMTSPPYMGKEHVEDPLTAYTVNGKGYSDYLLGIQNIYSQMKKLMKPNARVVIEVSNLKHDDVLTTLAWDIGKTVSQILKFEGEIIVGWDHYGFGYDHSYCLIFSKSE